MASKTAQKRVRKSPIALPITPERPHLAQQGVHQYAEGASPICLGSPR